MEHTSYTQTPISTWNSVSVIYRLGPIVMQMSLNTSISRLVSATSTTSTTTFVLYKREARDEGQSKISQEVALVRESDHNISRNRYCIICTRSHLWTSAYTFLVLVVCNTWLID